MTRSLRTPFAVVVGVILAMLFVCDCFAQTVVIVASDSLKSTRRSISGARSVIRSEHPEAEFIKVRLSSDQDVFEAQLDSIKASQPALLLTVGSEATQVTRDNFSDIPIVFTSVLYPVISGFISSFARPGEMTGASLDIPTDIQFEKYLQIIPDMKTIGVLYTSNTASLIPPSRVVAANMGLELVALEVKTPRDLPRCLDSLAKVADGLWSVADHNLFDPQSTKYILLNSIRRGLPFMGFSRHVVESGALFALDFDYKAIGKQAGRLVNRVLSGEPPGKIPVTRPDFLWFHYNEKTAEHVNVTIPPELVAVAKEVYR